MVFDYCSSDPAAGVAFHYSCSLKFQFLDVDNERVTWVRFYGAPSVHGIPISLSSSCLNWEYIHVRMIIHENKSE